MAMSAPAVDTEVPLERSVKFDPEYEKDFPVDDSDGGCSCEQKCREYYPWTRQIDSIEIMEGDAIGDSFEIIYLLRMKKIENVIIMGVHTNMCILARTFAIRQLVKQKFNVLLMRDMTDSMYNPKMSPFVDHFTGTHMVIKHIEKFWCPTITSDKIIGGKPFRFKKDTTECER